MGKIVITEFMTLDGVVESPEAWSFPYWDDGIAKIKNDELFSADALLLGRITYQGFAEAWPDRTDETGYADRINSLPKYVVSATDQAFDWNNTTVIAKDAKDQIQALKTTFEGDILVFGSAQLAEMLLENELVDEYRLLQYPLVLGSGKKLFAKQKVDLDLLETKSFASGVVLLSYACKK